MIILAVLIFPFALLAELMKMNNGGDVEDEKIHLLASEEKEN